MARPSETPQQEQDPLIQHLETVLEELEWGISPRAVTLHTDLLEALGNPDEPGDDGLSQLVGPNMSAQRIVTDRGLTNRIMVSRSNGGAWFFDGNHGQRIK